MVRVIQVGLGFWGFDWACSVLPTVPSVEVVAYVDGAEAARSRIQETLGVPASACFATLSEALAATDAEIVLATVRTDAHYPVAKAALDAGRHVLVEKPFTTTLAEAKDLVALARRQDRLLMVSQNYRFYPAAVLAADLVAARTLGNVGLIGIDFRQHAPSIGYRYWDFPDPLLADMSIHHFDLMRMVLGDEPKRVSCRTWNPPGSPFHNHPIGIATFEFRGGTIVSYRGSWMSGGNPTAWAGEWTIDCENGELWWTSRGPGNEPPLARERVLLHARGGVPTDQPLPTLVHLDRAGTIAAMADAVVTGRIPPRFSSGADNLLSLAMVEGSIRSAGRDGAWIEIDDLLGDNRKAA